MIIVMVFTNQDMKDVNLSQYVDEQYHNKTP